MKKKILVTGATGFLGSHIIEELVKAGHHPIILVRPSSNYFRISHLLNNLTVFVLDHIESLNTLFRDYNIGTIIHTANSYGDNGSFFSVLETNVLLPVKLIEIGQRSGLELFINTDSFFAKKEFEACYMKDYTTSKRILESFLKDSGTKLRIANLRLEHIYGERDSDKKFIPQIIKQLCANESNILLTHGNHLRDFIYISDVVKAYIKVMEYAGSATGFEEYEVGTGSNMSVRDFVEKLAVLLKSRSKLLFGSIPVKPGEIEASVANISKLEQLGWKPLMNVSEAIGNIVKSSTAIQDESIKI